MFLSAELGRCVHAINLVESCSLLYRFEMIKEVGAIIVIAKLDLTGRVESETEGEDGRGYSFSILVVLGPVR